MIHQRSAVRTVRQAMTADVVSIHPDQSVGELIGQLADSRVSGLPVIDSRRRLLGVVSTTDLLSAFAEAGDDEARERLIQQTARDIMTPRGLVVDPNLELREAALQMEYGDVRRLFVEEEGQVIGVISRSDINRAYALGLLE